MPSISKELLNRIAACQECSTMDEHRKFPSSSHGNISSSYMLVSEAPAKASLDREQYWRGRSGQLLRSAARQAGCELETLFYLTDIVKCWPKKGEASNRTPSQEEIDNCSRYLDEEIRELQPKLIVAFGGKVSKYLLSRNSFGMIANHGSIFDTRGTKVLTLIHPSHVLRNRTIDNQQYTRRIATLFNVLQSDDIDNIEAFFLDDNETQIVEDPSPPNISGGETGPVEAAFIMPAPGNSITQKDIYKDQIRVTVDFKPFFPSNDSTLFAIIRGQPYRTRMRYQERRSYIWKLGHRAIRALGLKSGDRILVEKLSDQQFRLSKYDE